MFSNIQTVSEPLYDQPGPSVLDTCSEAEAKTIQKNSKSKTRARPESPTHPKDCTITFTQLNNVCHKINLK